MKLPETCLAWTLIGCPLIHWKNQFLSDHCTKFRDVWHCERLPESHRQCSMSSYWFFPENQSVWLRKRRIFFILVYSLWNRTFLNCLIYLSTEQWWKAHYCHLNHNRQKHYFHVARPRIAKLQELSCLKMPSVLLDCIQELLVANWQSGSKETK